MRYYTLGAGVRGNPVYLYLQSNQPEISGDFVRCMVVSRTNPKYQAFLSDAWSFLVVSLVSFPCGTMLVVHKGLLRGRTMLLLLMLLP